MPKPQFIHSLMVVLATIRLCGRENAEQKEAKFILKGKAFLNVNRPDKAELEFKNAIKLAPLAALPRFELGLAKEAQGDLRGAFADFTIADQQDKNFYPASLKIAQYLIGAEMLGDAQTRINTVLADAPTNAEAHALEASIRLREKDYEDAEAQAQRALELDRSNISAAAVLGGLYEVTGKHQKALDAIDQGIRQNPTSVSLRLLKISIFRDMKDLSKIDETYREIFKLTPQEYRFWVDLAEANAEQGSINQAASIFSEGIKELPENWELKHQFVLFLDQNKGPEFAENEIDELMRAHPDDEHPYQWLADLYEKHADSEKAVELLSKIISHDEKSSSALNARSSLASIYLKKGNTAVANKLVTVVLAKNPSNISALLTRAKLSINAADYEHAVADLRTVLGLNQSDAIARQLLGEAYLSQGRLDLAIDAYKQAAQLRPNDTDLQVRLAQLIGLTGDSDQASDVISTAYKAQPDNPVAWETAARIAIGAKKWIAAQAALKKLDALDGQHPTVLFLQGQIAELTGSEDQAAGLYTKAINYDPSSPLASHALRAYFSLEHKSGHVARATKYLSGLTPMNSLILTLLGEAAVEDGARQKAEEYFDDAIKAGPESADPYIGRAKLLVQDRQVDAAVKLLEDARITETKDFRVPLLEASLLVESGDYDRAKRLYLDVLKRDAGQTAAANNLAEMIADHQFADSRALETARNISERFTSSSNPFLLDTLAWVYYRQGNLLLALNTINSSVKMLPNAMPPQLHYHYGVILIGNGDRTNGLVEIKKALSEGTTFPGFDDARRLLADQELPNTK